jgi:hypothetical protein
VVGRGFYRRRRAPSRLAADLNGNQNNETRREGGREEGEHIERGRTFST